MRASVPMRLCVPALPITTPRRRIRAAPRAASASWSWLPSCCSRELLLHAIVAPTRNSLACGNGGASDVPNHGGKVTDRMRDALSRGHRKFAGNDPIRPRTRKAYTLTCNTQEPSPLFSSPHLPYFAAGCPVHACACGLGIFHANSPPPCEVSPFFIEKYL